MTALLEAPLTVLIIEDEQAIRRFVRAALEGEGHRVHETGTLQRGLLEAGTRKPDLVILDLGLPDGDGVDFIRDLRTWSGMPVLVLSARVEEYDKVEALDAGADDYLVKPFGVEELLARVRAVCRRRLSEGTSSLSYPDRLSAGDRPSLGILKNRLLFPDQRFRILLTNSLWDNAQYCQADL